MSKIYNGRHKGSSIATSIGIITFDANGIADVDDEEMVEKLLQLDGYERPDSEEADKQPEQSEQPQNETKQPAAEENSSEEENDQKNDESTSEDEKEKADSEELTEEVLTTKNVPQLRKIAKDNNIDLNGATKKDEIVAIILGSLQ